MITTINEFRKIFEGDDSFDMAIIGEHEGEPVRFSGQQLLDVLRSCDEIATGVTDFIEKVTAAVTDETPTLSVQDKTKLKKWFEDNNAADVQEEDAEHEEYLDSTAIRQFARDNGIAFQVIGEIITIYPSLPATANAGAMRRSECYAEFIENIGHNPGDCGMIYVTGRGLKRALDMFTYVFEITVDETGVETTDTNGSVVRVTAAQLSQFVKLMKQGLEDFADGDSLGTFTLTNNVGLVQLDTERANHDFTDADFRHWTEFGDSSNNPIFTQINELIKDVIMNADNSINNPQQIKIRNREFYPDQHILKFRWYVTQ